MMRYLFFWRHLVCSVIWFTSAHAQIEIKPCRGDSSWLPNTPAVVSTKAPPKHPEPDCPFYLAAWQTMLVATQLDGDGTPAFLKRYSTIEDLFGAGSGIRSAPKKVGTLSLLPRNLQRPNEKLLRDKQRPTAIAAGVNQAGMARGLMIDQNGNPIYYAIHVNDVFAQFIRQNFIRQNNQLTKDALLNAEPDKLEFPTGAVELKSAWQVVEKGNASTNYITVKAQVPILAVKNGDLTVTAKNRDVTVALIALHVVFVLKDHPEFVWSTFEHIGADGQGIRDNAPEARLNPTDPLSDSVVSQSQWTLFKAGTNATSANIPNLAQDRINSFDSTTQKFNRNGKILQTSVYRAYPASKLIETDEDPDVKQANASMQELFAGHNSDRRKNYQLVGAVWLDDPAAVFTSGKLFANKPGESSDRGMVAGEDALSSTAMESFTQIDSPNCFSCHNTTRVTDDLTNTQIVGAKRLNVSHVLSRYLSGFK